MSKQVRFNEGTRVLQQVNTNTQSSQSSSKMASAIQELRNSFHDQANKMISSRVSDQLNESVQTIARSPGPCQSMMCAPMCQPMPMCQPHCQPQCQPQQQPQAYVVNSGVQKKKSKKVKKVKEVEEISTIAVTPRKQRMVMKDPEIDHIKREIEEMERIIRQLELQPKQQTQQEIEINVDDNKKCLKKLCKKIKAMEKELYDVARQRDEALIIKTQLERENQEMFDRIGELESVLKVADRKVFDLSIQVERQAGYIKQLEDEVERLRRKKKRPTVQQQDHTERVVEKIVEKPIEVIRVVEKIVEVPRDVIREVPVERIVERIVEVPRIEYVYEQVPQYVDRYIDVPVDRIVEVPVYQYIEVDRPVYNERVREVPVDRIVEVPYEIIREVPVEVIREVPYEVIKEVPYEVIKEVPYEVIKERIVEVPKYIEVPVDRIVRQEYPVEYPVDRYVEVPVDRYVEVPVDRVVEVPVDRVREVPVDRYVEVPVDRIVEVPYEVERWHRDDREIHNLNEQNRELVNELAYIRDRLRLEIERSDILEGSEMEFLRNQVLALEVAVRSAQVESMKWEERAVKLESEVHKERNIVSDLQNRLDQMYYQIEILTSDNNQKNEDFARYLEKLERRHKKDIYNASQPTVVQHYLVDQGADGQVQTAIQHPSARFH